MIVAHLVSAETSSSFTVYQLEDGTGRISAREWFSDDHSRSNIDPRSTKGHRYVRIIGTVDQFRDGAKSIKVTFIRECPDPHEAYYHFLECCAVSLLQQTGTIVSVPLPLHCGSVPHIPLLIATNKFHGIPATSYFKGHGHGRLDCRRLVLAEP